jgi:asparagine synthase (glutamine-hydrolysing)
MRIRHILELDRYVNPTFMHSIDRCSMAHSLEVRLPFLDHNLVDFAVNLPADVMLCKGWYKHVLRMAFPDLPSTIRWRSDTLGFSTPAERWLKVELAGLIETTFRRSTLGEMAIIDDKLFLEHYRMYRSGKPGVFRKGVTRVLMAECWARMLHGLPALDDR